MCYCGLSGGTEKIMNGLKTTISRGPDDQRIVKVQDGLLGFQRLSIMGLTPEGMQPFELDGDFAVCNGEIYGFKKQREQLMQLGYTFRSDSDCEILLPMYREYGTDMFAMLDAQSVSSSLHAIR